MRTLIYSIVLVFLASYSVAQDTSFVYLYGGQANDHCLDMISTPTRSYTIVGATSSFGSGGMDIYLLQVDSNNQIDWSVAIGGANSEWGVDIDTTIDGGYIIAGYTNSFGNGGYDAYLVKTDSIGNALWERTYGGTDWDFGSSVAPLNDGGFILLGHTYSYGLGQQDIYLIRTDQNGDTIWTRTIGGIANEKASRVIINNFDQIVICGTTESSGAGQKDRYFARLDMNGTLLNETTYGDIGDDIGHDIIQIAPNEYVMIGATDSLAFNDLDITVTKIDSGGNIIWERLHGGFNADDEEMYRIAELSTGELVTIGYTRTFGVGNGEKEIYMLALTADGWYITASTWGGAALDEGFAFHGENDSSYVIAGTTYSYGSGFSDIIFIRMDTLRNGYTKVFDTIPDNALGAFGSKISFSLQVFPNPANEVVYIGFENINPTSATYFDLYDLTGRLISTTRLNVSLAKYDSRHLRNGMYIYSIRQKEINIQSGKLIKN